MEEGVRCSGWVRVCGCVVADGDRTTRGRIVGDECCEWGAGERAWGGLMVELASNGAIDGGQKGSPNDDAKMVVVMFNNAVWTILDLKVMRHNALATPARRLCPGPTCDGWTHLWAQAGWVASSAPVPCVDRGASRRGALEDGACPHLRRAPRPVNAHCARPHANALVASNKHRFR